MSEGSIRETRFVEIDDLDGTTRPSKRERGKVEVVITVGDILMDLEPKEYDDSYKREDYKQLVESVVKHTRPLLPLLGLGGGPPHSSREGRGSYEEAPVVGKKRIVYRKGVGNKDLLLEHTPAGSFPGYPSDARRLIFDRSISASFNPWMIGTEVLPVEMLEFINACVVFAEIAKREKWTDITQALDKGVTIPIGLISLPELSATLKKLLQERIDKYSPHQTERDFLLSCLANFKGVGVVGQIVPCDKRKARIHEPRLLKQEALNPNISKTTGRTLRRLLEDTGIVYKETSAHGGNVYQEGFIAQADNSDLVFLGDYDSSDERAALIYRQLNRYDNLTPLAFPLAASNISFREIAAGQKVFWEEFLKGVAHPDAITQLPRLMPILREQINLAVALLTEKKLSSDAWFQLAQRRKDVLRQHDRFDASAELDRAIPRFLSPDQLADFKAKTNGDGPLGAQSVLQFLEFGDIEALYRDPRLKPVLYIADAIFDIPDEHAEERDKLLEAVGAMQLRRRYEGIEGRDNIDIIDLFNNKHLEQVLQLIRSKEYKSAEYVLQILTEIQKWPFSVPDTSTHEYPELHYATELFNMYSKRDRLFSSSGRKERYQEDLQVLLGRLKEMSGLLQLRSRIDAGVRLIESSPDKNLNIYSFAARSRVANPDLIFAEIIGRDIASRGNIDTRIQAFSNVYMRQLAFLDDTDKMAPQELIDGLETIVRVHGDYDAIPELAFIHNLIMTGYFSTIDIERARKYFNKAVAYYSTTYRERQAQFGVDFGRVFTDPDQFARERKEASMSLAREYRRLGFDKVASFYSNRSGQAN